MRMAETVIKWCRPQMVGNYYEPYRISWYEAIEELEKTYSGVKRDYVERKGAWLSKQYEVVDMKLEKAFVDYIPDDALDRFYDEPEENEDEWCFDEDDVREWERDLEWL